MDLPFVSCIMPTYNRRTFVPQAIKYFLRQDYPYKELTVVDDGTDKIHDLIPDSAEIKYIALSQRITVGEKRNLAIEASHGEIILHWDDDDWMHPRRINCQIEYLLRTQADISGIREVLFCQMHSGKLWLYEYPERQQVWLYGGSLCYRKSLWARKRFAHVNTGEDTRFVWMQPAGKISAQPDYKFYIAIIHSHNTSDKSLSGRRWRPWNGESARELMPEDWNFYLAGQEHAAEARPSGTKRRPTALVSAGSGIGDILRITPLIRVFAQLGYHVDVLLAPDSVEVVKLLEGAPEIRRIFCAPGPHANDPQPQLEGVRQEVYDVATFTTWSAHLQRLVKARRTLAFEPSQWRREGDIACVQRMARMAGWERPLPAPFAMPSKRQFDLPADTIALHPGCKPNWPWKKWHGFEELARLLPAVAIIGMPSDLRNEQTYFRRAFKWPDHAKNFVGKLSLPETAALLRQCAALISNDSGMMHLGVALGVPTFGIFGITSQQREAMPVGNMFPITKGLPCEPACRQRPWGRRDCEYHLECLKSLTAQEVLDKVRQIVPPKHQLCVIPTLEPGTMDALNVVYYGYVFDASGYGHAARAYIHALHKAGITLSVVDLAGHPPQVQDALVASLMGRSFDPDFHLFHGIPPQWARLAFRVSNAIGMTVWEADGMPSQWRNILNHVLDVWLPCEFNVAVFSRALERPVFKLPHPIFPPQSDGQISELESFLGIAPGDFAFYSVFEWQDRKSPLGLITSYLHAFPTQSDTVLLIKTNPGAATVARQAIETARRQVRSGARVDIRSEAWTEAQIEALHKRGDCYVSLHRGEGWGYPLFEAASRGTPVIATGYAGPLDYLNPKDHHLVHYELRAVRQPYVYYRPHMRWAEPDCMHAAERMQWVYNHRALAKEQAAKGAEKIHQAFALESIGGMARSRLLQLLQHTQPQRWQHLERTEHTSHLKPALPIPGEWYDEEYFETGRKSNWTQGYTWSLFSGVFRETAAFLTEMFPEASSYLDIGCAKGFLVRTLRDCGKEGWGVDHSPWAIERAEESVKPFVTLANVDEVRFDRRFDLLLAFEVLEELTDAQIVSFLSRARAWTEMAIFATIPSFHTAEEETRYWKDNNDLSHVTMRSREWWHEMFLSTGWRQDPLHRVAARICQAHALPTKMGWKVYVYAP
jgi:ADP-heptose:LPS heptosyltransferase/2-polyprenyl-3-methyl-5-hydroxy-6-metoxy-1,4-benzoquinol methylase/glycosyltransferase involved in cell wall biosynthesis